MLVKEAMNRLADTSMAGQWLKKETGPLRFQLCKVAKTREGEASGEKDRSHHSRTPESCIRLLQDKLDFLKQFEFTVSYMKFVSCGPMNAKIDVNVLVEGLPWSVIDSCTSIRRNLYQCLVLPCKRIKKVLIKKRWLSRRVRVMPFAVLCRCLGVVCQYF